MKCPKCGYNSFEIHDTCKKCAYDLTGYKDIHGLKPIVLPQDTRTNMANKLRAEKDLNATDAEVETPVDMFSFAVPESNATEDAGSFLKDDPFDFGDGPAVAPPEEDDFFFGKEQTPAQSQAGEETFAELLESSSHNKSGADSTPQRADAGDQVALDLNDFNWDDTPDPAPGESAKPAEEDFNSLFGDTDDTAKK